MIQLQDTYRQIDPHLSAAVSDAVTTRGIPTTIAAANDLADDVFPAILQHRRYLAAQEKSAILQSHPDLTVPEPPFYPLTATRKMVYRSAGLQPQPQLAEVEVFDTKTQSLQRKSVPPAAYPGEEEMLEEVGRRITAAAGRHSRQASRDTVIRAAVQNRVGWARQLAGAENCGFCAMLASRGAVYSKETVNFRTHDNCDCTATIVIPGEMWAGEVESIRLSSIWGDTRNLKDFTKKYRELTSND